jgi:hypothetical protein
VQYVTHADLARDPEGVLDSVRGGEPALVEHEVFARRRGTKRTHAKPRMWLTV